MHTTFYKDFSTAATYDWSLASPYFTPIELRCKGDGSLLVHWPSLVLMNKLRQLWGKPIQINSYYRSPEHNKKIGGSPNSQHLLGRAFDCRVTDPKFVEMASKLGFNGIGLYDTFTHIDTRQGQARWDYRSK
jgi:zinc D-Ala-D-Ala carboxypeptidase